MALSRHATGKVSFDGNISSGEMHPRELPIVGGNLALDFANTVDDPDGPERHDHAGTYPSSSAGRRASAFCVLTRQVGCWLRLEEHPRLTFCG